MLQLCTVYYIIQIYLSADEKYVQKICLTMTIIINIKYNAQDVI